MTQPYQNTATARLIAARIRDLAHKKTQAEIASEAGFPNANMMTFLKNGRNKVPLDRVPSLAKALEIDPAYLMRLALDQAVGATPCGRKDNCLGEAGRCMTHELWTSLNEHMVAFLDSVTLQKLVDDQLAKGIQIENKPAMKRAISAMPVVKPIRVNAPNSVFALGNVFAKN